MPDESYDDDDQDNESRVIKELRKKASRVDELDAELKALRQEAVMLKAEIPNLTPDKQRAIMAAIDGDLTVEAARQKATDFGWLDKPPAPADAPQVPAEEQEAHRRMAEVTAAAQPSEAQAQTLQDRMRAAKSAEELAAILDSEGLLLVDE